MANTVTTGYNSTLGKTTYTTSAPTSAAPVSQPAPTPTPSSKGTQPQPTPTPAPAPNPTLPSANTNPDAAFANAKSSVNPTAAPTPEDFYKSVYSQLSPVLDAISQSETVAERNAATASTTRTSQNNFALNAQGLAGSSEAGSMAGNNQAQFFHDVEAAKATQADAISKVTQFAIPEAYSQYTDALTRNDANSNAYIKQAQTNLNNSLTGLAASGLTLSDIEQSNPLEYQTLLQYANGDKNILTDMYISAASQNKKLLNNGNPLTQIGNNLTYGVQGVDANGNPTINTITQTLPFDVPATYGWTANKVGTTLTVITDPNNAANTISYATNPFTGEITINGSGSGLDALKNAGIEPGSTQSSSTGNGGNNAPDGSSNATTTIATALGVDPSTPLSNVVQNVGLGSIVQAIVKNEGGSPAGVSNNPGNIKYTGAPGQTDSGVKASDGGTFASYDSPQSGLEAVGKLVTSAASGTSSAYGANPTVQSFVEKYTNTGSAPSTSVGSNGLSTSEYGLLANVPNFNPTVPGVDQAALNYIKLYMSGANPAAADVGISSRSGSLAAFNTVKQRAADVFQQATGQNLPNSTIINSNLGLISGNNTLLNNLKVQEGTISKNFGLNLENLNANKVNQGAPAINNTADALAKAAGNTSVAQYLAQNETIQNELGSLLSLKNAGGTTVADKIAAGDLLPSDLSADQQKAVLDVLLKEANNAKRTIGEANDSLYQQVDPLGLDPQNPVNQPGYKSMINLGFSNNYDGTFSAPDGSVYKDDGSGNPMLVQ